MKPKWEVIEISGTTESGIQWTSTITGYGPGSKFTRGPIVFTVGSEVRSHPGNSRESFETADAAKKDAERAAASIKLNQ